jgi:hypothetical protein
VGAALRKPLVDLSLRGNEIAIASGSAPSLLHPPLCKAQHHPARREAVDIGVEIETIEDVPDSGRSRFCVVRTSAVRRTASILFSCYLARS